MDFVPFGEGVSDEWIDAAEKRLGIILPESYKWWLKNYSGGEVYGEEIYSIYEIDFDEVVGGDIVYVNELARKDNADYNSRLVISEPNDEIYYFDLKKGLVDGEYKVYELNNGSLFAGSFAEFLSKMIKGY